MKNLLREAAFEIRELRKQNQLLRARTDVLDLFAHVAGARQNPSGMSPDVAHALEGAAKELEAKETPAGEAVPVQTVGRMPGRAEPWQQTEEVRKKAAASGKRFGRAMKKAKRAKGGAK